MNDQTTTDGDDTPDEHVLAALRDVEPTEPTVRRAHLAAALAEYDRLGLVGEDAPLAPLVPLRRRSTRVLQVAAAILLVVAGVGAAVRLGSGTSDQQADTAGSAGPATTAARDGLADSGAASAAAGDLEAPAFSEESQEATARAAADDAAKAAGAPASAPQGALGDYATAADLRAAVLAMDAAGTLPQGATPGLDCPGSTTSASGTSATVAGRAVVAWVQRSADGTAASVVLVDPATCQPVG